MQPTDYCVILGIDPGSRASGWVLGSFPPDRGARPILAHGVSDNLDLLAALRSGQLVDSSDAVAIEKITSYGMVVGADVFDTCRWCGRFVEAIMGHWTKGAPVLQLPRKSAIMHICGTPRAKDPHIRQALIDLYPGTGGGKVPQIGTKAQPGPLYGVASHMWAALAVAHTAHRALVKPEEIPHDIQHVGDEEYKPLNLDS
jgi:hypothetical protein